MTGRDYVKRPPHDGRLRIAIIEGMSFWSISTD
jgi:hypothetical protein